MRMRLEFVPDDELQLYFAAADLVVLPFEEILNSGSAILALSFNCPIYVPHSGALVELRDMVGVNWVKTYLGSLTPEGLADAMEWALETRRGLEAPLHWFEWPNVAKQTVEGYRSVIEGTCLHAQ
jgi:glycosyltransferase involved in cell wall biosynthesis